MEVTMALAVLVMLSAGIFAITVGTFQLSSELKEHQDKKITHRRMVEIMESNFEALPASTSFRLQMTQTGSAYTGVLTLKNAPQAFRRSNRANDAVETVVIRTDRGRGGFIRVSLVYLNQEQSRANYGGDGGIPGDAPFIVLSDRMKQFQWEFLDPDNRRWVRTWNDDGKRPLLVALTLAHEGERKAVRHVFWIPPRINN